MTSSITQFPPTTQPYDLEAQPQTPPKPESSPAGSPRTRGSLPPGRSLTHPTSPERPHRPRRSAVLTNASLINDAASAVSSNYDNPRPPGSDLVTYSPSPSEHAPPEEAGSPVEDVGPGRAGKQPATSSLDRHSIASSLGEYASKFRRRDHHGFKPLPEDPGPAGTWPTEPHSHFETTNTAAFDVSPDMLAAGESAAKKRDGTRRRPSPVGWKQPLPTVAAPGTSALAATSRARDRETDIEMGPLDTATRTALARFPDGEHSSTHVNDLSNYDAANLGKRLDKPVHYLLSAFLKNGNAIELHELAQKQTKVLQDLGVSASELRGLLGTWKTSTALTAYFHGAAAATPFSAGTLLFSSHAVGDAYIKSVGQLFPAGVPPELVGLATLGSVGAMLSTLENIFGYAIGETHSKLYATAPDAARLPPFLRDFQISTRLQSALSAGTSALTGYGSRNVIRIVTAAISIATGVPPATRGKVDELIDVVGGVIMGGPILRLMMNWLQTRGGQRGLQYILASDNLKEHVEAGRRTRDHFASVAANNAIQVPKDFASNFLATPMGAPVVGKETWFSHAWLAASFGSLGAALFSPSLKDPNAQLMVKHAVLAAAYFGWGLGLGAIPQPAKTQKALVDAANTNQSTITQNSNLGSEDELGSSNNGTDVTFPTTSTARRPKHGQFAPIAVDREEDPAALVAEARRILQRYGGEAPAAGSSPVYSEHDVDGLVAEASRRATAGHSETGRNVPGAPRMPGSAFGPSFA